MDDRELDRSAFDSQEVARALLVAAPGGVVRVRKDGRILEANPEACRILGLRHDELTRRIVADFETEVIDEQRRPVPAEELPVSQALRTGRPAGPRTLGVRRPDGVTSWAVYHAVPTFDPEGRTTGAVVAFLDITARIRIEAELRASEERWRSFAESIPDFVVMLDPEGCIREINRISIGRERAEVIGTHVSAFCPPNATALVMERLAHVLSTGETVRFEVEAYDGNGQLDWYEDTMAPLRRDGRIVGAALIAHAITSRKRLQDELARSQRLASIGMLAAGVAHEINNPLTYIMGNLEHALARADAPELVHALEEARAGAERVSCIVRDLRLLVRRDDDVVEAVDLRRVARAAVGLAEGELRQRARVVLDLSEVPAVLANEGRLVQVAINLLVNAAQAATTDPARHEIRLRTGVADGHVELVVEDDGAGISAADLPRIFDPFFSTKPAALGTGLGLAICHSIVTSLGGSIAVDSAPGQGSRFCVRLPVGDGGVRTTVPGVTVPTATTARAHVLVVDDDVAVARAVALMLSHMHDVTVAHGGDEALALVSSSSFDVVLCDVMMPNVDGLEVHSRVRAHAPDLAQRFVLMTGGVLAPELQARIAGLGVPCLGKPFDRAGVLAAIAGVVRDRQ